MRPQCTWNWIVPKNTVILVYTVNHFSLMFYLDWTIKNSNSKNFDKVKVNLNMFNVHVNVQLHVVITTVSKQVLHVQLKLSCKYNVNVVIQLYLKYTSIITTEMLHICICYMYILKAFIFLRYNTNFIDNWNTQQFTIQTS